MQRRFEQDLNTLRDRLLYMGRLVENAIQNSIQAVTDSDDAAVQKVLEREDEINRLHIEIDEEAVKLLALQQPMAVDLRFITATIKINTDLERVADHAVNIARCASYLRRQPHLEQVPDLLEMAEIAQQMVRESLDAFITKNVEQARAILLQDDRVDWLKDKIFRDRMADMKKNPEVIEPELDTILIARNLERMADHATNIAEDVIFMVLGKDIRHHTEEKL